MFKINHAILHVFHFVSCVNVFSQEELDLSDKNVKSYVQRVAKHALGNIDNKRGEFEAESGFKNELSDYLNGQNNFTDLSLMIAEFLGSELGRAEQPASCDLLVVDFEDSPRAPKLTTEDIAELSEEEATAAQAELDAAFAGRSARYFGLLLLESKPAFMHEVGKAEDGASVNRIERHHAILPSPSQKISSFALVDVRTMSVQFVDKAREIAGEERYLIPQGLLQCTMEASSKELIDTTMRLVEEVANEYGTNAAIATAKAKAYVAENAEDSDEVPFDEFVEEVSRTRGRAAASSKQHRRKTFPSTLPSSARSPSASRATTRSAPTPASRSPSQRSTRRIPSSSSSPARQTGLSASNSKTSEASRTSSGARRGQTVPWQRSRIATEAPRSSRARG